MMRESNEASRGGGGGGGLVTTLVYGGVRIKGQIQTQKYGSIKTGFPNFSA